MDEWVSSTFCHQSTESTINQSSNAIIVIEIRTLYGWREITKPIIPRGWIGGGAAAVSVGIKYIHRRRRLHVFQQHEFQLYDLTFGKLVGGIIHSIWYADRHKHTYIHNPAIDYSLYKHMPRWTFDWFLGFLGLRNSKQIFFKIDGCWPPLKNNIKPQTCNRKNRVSFANISVTVWKKCTCWRWCVQKNETCRKIIKWNNQWRMRLPTLQTCWT